MSSPQAAVSERSVSVTVSGDSYTVADVPTAETLIAIQALADQVQLPNGLAYDTGEVAFLTVAQVDELAAAGEGVSWQNDGIASPIAPEGSPLSAVVAGVDVDDSIAALATNQYTDTVTFASGDTAAYDETNSVAAGVVWATSDAAVATIAATGLATAVAAGTCTFTATYQGVSATSPVLTVT